MATLPKITGTVTLASVALSTKPQNPLGLTIDFVTPTTTSPDQSNWIGSAVVDAQGFFEVQLAHAPLQGAKIAYSIYKGTQLLLKSETAYQEGKPLTIVLDQQQFDYRIADDSRIDDTINYAVIKGHVTLGPENITAIPLNKDKVSVKAKKALFRDSVELGSTSIDAFGNYELKVPYRLLYPEVITSPPTKQTAIPNIMVDLCIDDLAIAGSEYLAMTENHIQVDLQLTDDVYFPQFYTEQAYLVNRLTQMTNLPVAQFYTIITEGPRAEVNSLVAASGLPAGRVRNMIAASDIANQLAITVELAYALVRWGAGSVEQCAQLDPEAVNEIITYSYGAHIITNQEDLGALYRALDDRKVNVTGADQSDDGDSLDYMLHAILNNRDQVKEFLQLNLDRDEKTVDMFWSEVSGRFGPATTTRLQRGLQLLAITGLQPQMTVALLNTGKDRALGDVLAEMSESAWFNYISDVCAQNGKLCIPQSIRGDVTDINNKEVKQAYAAQLRALSSDLFATAVNKNMLRNDPVFAAKFSNPEAMLQFLNNNADYDLRVDNAWDQGFGGNQQLKKDMLPLQNLSRLTGGQPEAVAALIKADIRSSGQIAAMQETEFVAGYATAFRSETLARQVYLKAVHTDMLVKQSYLQVMPGTYVDKVTKDWTRDVWVADKQASPPGNPTSPDLETLFGSLDFCSCSDCTSMYSPAAYYTDVLNFIKTRLGSSAAYDELLRRRPDLVHIDLSCKNSNMPMPYIDLVNEQLELMILRDIRLNVPGESNLFIPKSFQTSGTAKELEAYPEHTYKDTDGTYKPYKEYTKVYDKRLKKAVYPNNLPFDLALEESRVYLKHLGFSRYDLMDRYKPVDYLTTTAPDVLSDYNNMAEALGLSRNAADIITKTANPDFAVTSTWLFYGYATPGTWYNDLCSDLEGLLKRCNITYKELLQLLVTDFLNKESIINGQRPFAIVAKPGKPVDTCQVEDLMLEFRPASSPPEDGTAARIAFFDKLHRFIRLCRATGWTIYQLDQVLAALDACGLPAGCDINIEMLTCVARIKLWSDKFGFAPEHLCILVAKMSTRRYINFDSDAQELMPSVYDGFFRNKTVINPPDPNFDDPNAISGSAADNAGTVTAAFNITGEDYALIIGGSTSVNIQLLSMVYRYGILAKAYNYTIKELAMALAIAAPIFPTGTPAQSIALWDQVFQKLDKIKAMAIDIRELAYLLVNADLDGNFLPETATVQPFFENMRLELRNQVSNSSPAVTQDMLEKLVTQQFSAAFNINNKLSAYLLDHVFTIGGVALMDVLTTQAFIDSTDPVTSANTIPGLAFQDLYDAYYKFDKTVALSNRLRLSAEELICFQDHHTALQVPDFNTINTWNTGLPALLFNLNDWVQVRDKLNMKKDTFTEILLLSTGQDKDGNATDKDTLLGKVFLATLWAGPELVFLAGDNTTPGILNLSFTPAVPATNSFAKGATLLQLIAIMDASLRTGIVSSGTYRALQPSITVPVSQAVRKAAKAKYDNDAWLKVAKPLQDELRKKQRDALVAYILAHPDIVPGNNMKWKNENGLFAYLLIDVEMESCMKTSRIKQGISTLQLFLDRVILNIERVNGGTTLIAISAEMTEQWQTWRKWYRVWEANRKVFLYPENWIEPELRDNKTNLFKDLENQLLQDEITAPRVEAAYRLYLENLDEVARLEPVSAYHEVSPGRDVVHVFSRTDVYPQRYYYRKLEDNEWSAWERLNVDIKSDHVAPVMWNNRLYLFWLTFQKRTLSEEEIGKSRKDNVFNGRNGAYVWGEMLTQRGAAAGSVTNIVSDDKNDRFNQWDITLNWSSYLDHKWQKSDLSRDVMNIDINKVRINNDARQSYSNVPYAQSVMQVLTKRGEVPLDELFRNRLYLYTPYEAKDDSEGVTFNLLFPAGLDENAIGLHTFLWKGDNSRDPYVLRDNDRGHQIIAPIGTRFNKMKFEEDPTKDGKLMKDSYISKTDGYYSYSAGTYINNFPRAVRTTSSQVILNSTPFNRFRITARAANEGVHGLNPLDDKFFFEDERNTFYVERLQHTAILKTTTLQGVLVPTKTSLANTLTFTAARYNLKPEALPLAQKATLYKAPVTNIFTTETYKFNTFYHAQSPKFISTLNNGGVPALLTLANQSQTDTMRFSDNYKPSYLVSSKYPQNNVQFDFSDPYSIYNWEIFFHVPMLIAQGLSNNQQFEEAQKWYHYIFNPTSNTNINGATIATNQRFWKFYPFYVESATPAQTLSQLLIDIHNNVGSAVQQVRKWEKNPFNPHIIARMRLLAYMKNVLMKYLDNLVAWGDQLYRRDTIESINEATQLYILAANLLGDRPKEIPARVKKAIYTFQELLQNGPLDALSNAMVAIESFFAPNAAPSGSGIKYTDPKTREGMALFTLYFCLPKNDKLLAYWDTIADRLFKIRNCMNIDGVTRQLPLYEPPIDPALLVRATAMGVNINTVLDEVNGVNVPLYRFSYMLQKANELTNDVKGLGGALLAAIEKKDAEALSLLRSGQEIQLLEKIKLVKERQLSEAQTALEALRRTRENTQIKLTYYTTRPFKNANEEQHLSRLNSAMGFQIAQGVLETTAGIVSILPTIHAQLIASGASFGGLQLANVMRAASSALGIKVGMDNVKATMAVTTGGYERRRDDWVFQANTATKELQQLDQQILGAEIRVDIAQKELANQELQIENARAVDAYMRGKFSNVELYNWMTAQVATTYFQSYQLAYDLAKRAEWCYRYELPHAIPNAPSTGFIKFGYWDSLRKGLMSGERLQFDLRKMEASYMEENKREFELTKNVSLAQFGTEALLDLRRTGKCEVEIPEVLFDLDYPGHYMRRIKSVSISIPCIAGPYTTISCELRQTKSKYRKTAVLSNVSSYAENPDPWHNAGTGYDNNRFNYLETGSAIATSTAQNDSGIFELNFRDERYLPFEGTGAISKWELSLPEAYRQFDYESISDVIFHIKYTAKEGGDILKTGAVNNISNLFKTLDNTVLYRYFSLRHEFSNEWFRYSKAKKNEEPGATFGMKLRPEDFPQFCKGKKIEITGWYLQLNPKDNNLGLVVNGPEAGINEILLKGREGATVNLTAPNYIQVHEQGVELPLSWTFTCDHNTEELEDFYLMAHYKISDIAQPPFTDCSRTVILQDFNGNNVSGYPAGVFDRKGNYVGMADTKEQYASMWNNAPANLGFAVITPTAADASFLLVGDPQATILTLRAMAAFRFDFSGSKVLDSISAPENSYIDFGDGTVIFTKHNATLPENTSIYRVNAPDTPARFYVRGTSEFDQTYVMRNYSCAYKHDYKGTGPYKVSVMFNLDADYILDMDNMEDRPMTTSAANLRGYLPVNTRCLEFTSTQNASFNTLNKIKNRADVIPNLWRFALRSGANNTIPGVVDFGTWDFPEVRCLDFGMFHNNQAWLYTPVLIKDLIGTTNLPAKYPKLHTIGFMGNKYSPDLNLAIPNIRFGMFGNTHGYAPENVLPPGAVDQIMIQLDSVKNDTGGKLVFGSEQPTTPAGRTAMQSLQNKGMTITFI
ncbi:neuraminidase-like domain-containing protein [Taibaiella chishuiensis]|uniref:Virulence plasmid A protein n=1 Tax=Taibaiella chishuiensis TaxID=1434707 RepID=A0A2P8D4F6_9BACT|nr:neuraminidase-like domain-containing protein [Taibaiella chishuiensis]PSK92104.1 virulence plasmid A protein [Taibaiella chishuiensis]